MATNFETVLESTIWFPFVWIGGLIAASIFYRLRAGRPIRPDIAHDALFTERNAGGPWASKCLLVSITTSELQVAPSFPLNLMFLPEIWGTEYRIPVSDIKSAEVFRGWFMNIRVELDSGRMITLKLKRPNSFLRALETADGHSRS